MFHVFRGYYIDLLMGGVRNEFSVGCAASTQSVPLLHGLSECEICASGNLHLGID